LVTPSENETLEGPFLEEKIKVVFLGVTLMVPKSASYALLVGFG
jgi:hypothetical protein